MSQLSEWNPINFENYYISAGLIDCNVRVNEDWESSENVTKSAVCGGVTCMAVETSLFNHTASLQRLHCDVGIVKIVSKAKQVIDGPDRALAFKTYLCPPSCYIDPGTDDLSDLLIEVEKLDMPLIIDVSMPTPRMLFMASPYRNTALADRTHASPTSEPTMAAGAFPHTIHSSSSSSDSDEDDGPSKTLSTVEMPQSDIQLSDSALPSIQLSMAIPALGPPPMEKNINRRSFMRTLADGLNEKVRSTKDDISLLSTVEQEGYSGAGITFFDERSDLLSAPAGSAAFTVPVPPPEPKVLEIKENKMFKNRMQRMRPTLLTVTSDEKPEESKDAIYVNHLANCPEHWETSGVDFVLSQLKRAPCCVHLCNLSSAAAINRIFSQRRKMRVTCETCPHYLTFSMEDVASGDTRIKTFPPIRNRANKSLLWELLKAEGIDIIASHHMSVLPSLKIPISRSFKRAVNGINGLGFTLCAVWSGLKPVHRNDFQHYFVRMSKWLSAAPAKMLNIAHIKGAIKPGLHADIVVWDPYEEFEAKSRSSLAALSPYEGKEMFGKVLQVYVRGKLTFDGRDSVATGMVISNSR